MKKIFNDVYRGKKVLVTGHTGFKGSWLSLWLTSLGADVTGISAYLPSSPCNFEVLGLDKKMKNYKNDIRELGKIQKIFDKTKPEIVFHLAAQAIVKNAHEFPKNTFDTNIGGTTNILECIRNTSSIKAAVIITSDKCYQNLEWPWGYRETDRLGGDDPYSASKACAEIVCNAYIKSYFSKRAKKYFPRISTTRAGNVIGGGDWAKDRIIPDCIRALAIGREINIRNPKATRPWQHVFEPLSGYLWVGASLLESDTYHGHAFNFGPDAKVNQSVKELINLIIELWGKGSWKKENDAKIIKENILLKLCCDKALHYLKWHSILSFYDSVRMTAEWYKSYYDGKVDMYQFSLSQISYFIAEAENQNLNWTSGG